MLKYLTVLVVVATASAQSRNWLERRNYTRPRNYPAHSESPLETVPARSSEHWSSTGWISQANRTGAPTSRAENQSTVIPVTNLNYNENQHTNIYELLEKMNDRLTGLSALDQQKMRKLENIDYKLTKLEVQLQEKAEVLKTELREVARRVQQLDWQSTKTDSKLEQLKEDLTYMRLAYANTPHTDHSHLCPETNDSRMSVVVDRVKQVGATISSVQLTLTGIQTSILDLKQNVTILNNRTRDILQTSKRDLLTKQFFNSAISGTKQYSLNISPHYSRPNTTDPNLVTDCRRVRDVLNRTVSGIYRIRPETVEEPFYAFCEMSTEDGGWTVIQNRFEGTIDFERGWQDYKHGFGNLNGEFWLGLEKIHRLTSNELYELRIDLEDFAHERKYARYMTFGIGPESKGYPLIFLGNYTGDAGDSMIYHAGQKFTTNDMDHDNWPEGNCAESHTGAWWYNGCDNSNLNGKYLHGEVPPEMEYQGVYWYEWRGPNYSLMKSRMMIRPKY